MVEVEKLSVPLNAKIILQINHVSAKELEEIIENFEKSEHQLILGYVNPIRPSFHTRVYLLQNLKGELRKYTNVIWSSPSKQEDGYTIKASYMLGSKSYTLTRVFDSLEQLERFQANIRILREQALTRQIYLTR